MYERVRCEICGSELEDGVDSIIDHVVDGDCERIRFLNEIGDLRRELALARTEAEGYRQQYEALRAAVEGVAERIEMEFERAYQRWDNTAEMYDQGFAHALARAEQMVRAVLEQDKQEVADDG